MKDFAIGGSTLPKSLPEGEYVCAVTFTVNDEPAFGYNIYATITKK